MIPVLPEPEMLPAFPAGLTLATLGAVQLVPVPAAVVVKMEDERMRTRPFTFREIAEERWECSMDFVEKKLRRFSFKLGRGRAVNPGTLFREEANMERRGR